MKKKKKGQEEGAFIKGFFFPKRALKKMAKHFENERKEKEKEGETGEEDKRVKEFTVRRPQGKRSPIQIVIR